jgi:hypothetical protein
MSFWKKRAFDLSGALVGLFIGFFVVGCETPSYQAPVPHHTYEIVWVQGTHEHPNYGVTLSRYYSDQVKYEGPWVIFVDKASKTTTRLAATNVVVYGGE